jgi:thiol-disulfide isomerase/thioredoxin
MRRFGSRLLGLGLGSLLLAAPLAAGELTRGIRLKLSAGDLRSGEALAEDWRALHGEDAEYLDGLGWLARGAELLGHPERAMDWVREVRARIPEERADSIVPLGAAIEVEGRVLAVREGRGAAIAFWRRELARASDPALRSRIGKNLALLSLEGSAAPEIDFADTLAAAGQVPSGLAAFRGRPVLLYFWAHWCGDCRAQAPAVARLAAKYAARGLAVVAPTRYYGTAQEGAEADASTERRHVAEVLAASHPGFESIPVPFSEAAMVAYGASATPTFALVDRDGIVRFYTPTRVSEAELERRIEELLAPVER